MEQDSVSVTPVEIYNHRLQLQESPSLSGTSYSIRRACYSIINVSTQYVQRSKIPVTGLQLSEINKIVAIVTKPEKK